MTELSSRHVDYALKQWGRWVWLYGESVGCYPGQSASVDKIERSKPFSWFRVRQLTAKGAGTRACGSHKILSDHARVMPEFVKQLHTAVGSLPEGQYMAAIVEYATGLDMNGDEWPDELKAFVLEISVEAFHERLKQVRKKISKKLGNITRHGVQSVHPRLTVTT